MDDIVKAALKKWPNVPHCYGWLALDARGDWFMRDERIQATGPFPQIKGSRVQHEKLKEFIGRNYASDEHGAWFFQNGPQRVYLQLEAAPWVLGVQRLAGGSDAAQAGFRIETHTGLQVTHVRGAWSDEQGRLFLETDQGLGVVRSLDMDVASDALSGGAWGELQELPFQALVQRFAYCLEPAPPPSV